MSKTYEEARDELARVMGWVNKYTLPEPAWDGTILGLWERGEERRYSHPVPTELGAVLALLPEGWEWARIPVRGKWVAGMDDSPYLSVQVPITGNHVHDATRLVLAALTASRKEKA